LSDDANYLANHKPDKLYVNPASKGAYATICGESEHVIGEIDVTGRFKIAVSCFYVNGRADFDTFKITKLQWRKPTGWFLAEHLHVNGFQLAQIGQLLTIIASLDLSDPKTERIALNAITVTALADLLSSVKGPEALRQLSQSPNLHHDIFAVAAKRKAIEEFERLMGTGALESAWQSFFERNTWIFGHGLNYLSLAKVGETLKAKTTGSTFDGHGKEADGLMKTRAEVSQFVIVEVKRDGTDLLRSTPYRDGCFDVSREVSGAVTQVQKLAFDFTRHRFAERDRTSGGFDTGEVIYAVEPRTYLIVGNSAQLAGHQDKIASFELYRRNVRSPEILTFDELLHRARFIVENVDRAPAVEVGPTRDIDGDIPF